VKANAQSRKPGWRSPEGRDLLTVPEAARRVGRHPETLYRLCRAGQFPPAVRIGSGWLVSVPRLDAWLHGSDTLIDDATDRGESP
jgi:excisionase family DNA binding protein